MLERRRHERMKVKLCCIQIEPDNGGVVLNLSEDGLSFQAMAPIHAGWMRFWFLCPHNGRIEASGDLSWTDGTNRVGGLRFVDVTEDVREHVRGRLAEFTPQPDAFPEAGDVADPSLDEEPISTFKQHLVRRVVTAGGILLFAIVGLYIIKVKQHQLDDSMAQFEQEPTIKSEPRPLPLGSTPASASRSPASQASSVGRSNARGASTVTADKPANNIGEPGLQIQGTADRDRQSPLKPSSAATTASVIRLGAQNGQLPGAGSVAAPPRETSITTSPSPNVNLAEGARAASTAEQESSLLPKQTGNPEVVKPSVSVSFGRYPSIRMPAELKAQLSRQSAPLHIGQLSSRVDPVYPEDAEAQRVEGTVELHAIISQDGTVGSVEPRNGPALLIPAAATAVRQWRYAPSSVGGQPVEAEEDITVTFQLLKQ